MAEKKAKKSVKKKKAARRPAARIKKKTVSRKKVKKKKKRSSRSEPANKYQRSFKATGFKIASEGGGPSDIAAACGVSPSTIYSWLKTRPSFEEACSEGERMFEDNAETLYRHSIMAQATPHDEVTIKVKAATVDGEVTIDGKDVEVQVPAIETETITKVGRFDVKPLAGYIHRRRPDRYAEKRVIDATDEIKEFADWIAGRGSDNDGSENQG